jgi:hypothetical protein
MSASYFLYTWSVPLYEETIPAKISVRAEKPERARQLVAKEVAKLQSLYRDIKPQEVSHDYGRDSADSLKSTAGYKLQIIAATTLEVRIKEVSEEIYTGGLLPERISALLERIEPDFEPSTKPRWSWDSEITICHPVPIGYVPRVTFRPVKNSDDF